MADLIVNTFQETPHRRYWNSSSTDPFSSAEIKPDIKKMEVVCSPSTSVEEPVKTTRKKRRSVRQFTDKNIPPDICAVCGDTATGYHYEVGSCNGCKTFFRRAVLGQKSYRCKKNGECKESINKEIRVKCRGCRLEKCIEVGMNPLGILSDSNPAENTVIKDILAKRKLELTDVTEPSTSQDTKIQISPHCVELTIDRLIDELLHLEVAHQRLRRSKYSPTIMDELTIEKVLEGHSKLSIDYGEMDPVNLKEKPPQTEWIPFEIRIKKRIPLLHTPRCGKIQSSYKQWFISELVYALEYLKTFEFFHKLNSKDKKVLASQIALICVQITQSFYSYEKKSDITINPDGMKAFYGVIPEEAEHEREKHYGLIQRLKEMDMDRTEYVLLKAIITCNPALEDLSSDSRGMMHEQREKYAKSLMSYVMARRGFSKGPSAYAEMMMITDKLIRLAKRQKDLHHLILALGLAPKWASNRNSLIKEIMDA